MKEEGLKVKTRDHHRVCFAGKIHSAALNRFTHVSVLWIVFSEMTLGHGPKNSRIRVKDKRGPPETVNLRLNPD